MAAPFLDDLSLPPSGGCGVGPVADAGTENYSPRGGPRARPYGGQPIVIVDVGVVAGASGGCGRGRRRSAAVLAHAVLEAPVPVLHLLGPRTPGHRRRGDTACTGLEGQDRRALLAVADPLLAAVDVDRALRPVAEVDHEHALGEAGDER